MAQTDEVEFREQSFLESKIRVPNSPEATSLGKYGDMKISHYTGAYNTSIPIYNIAGKDISNPINLNYNSGGNKVLDEPSWVGLGWTLETGGVITRAVAGMPDMRYNYYGQDINQSSSVPNIDVIAHNEYLYKIAKRELEVQPDAYYLNFPGGAAKFFITKDQKILFEDTKDFKIDFSFFEEDIISFKITDTKGNIYRFESIETTNLLLDDEFGNILPAHHQFNYVSAWHLTSITNANQTEMITYSYSDPIEYIPTSRAYYGQSITYLINSNNQQIGCNATACGPITGGQVSSNGNSNPSETIINRIFLENIDYNIKIANNPVVTFQTINSVELIRQNSTNVPDAIELSNIIVKHNFNNILEYNFDYSDETGRLTLKSLTEKEYTANGQGISKNPHTFEYENGQLPDKYSLSVDHWGYYNAAGNQILIPSYNNVGINHSGANRETDYSTVLFGLLNRVNYPTGGYSKIEYECNRVAPYNTNATEDEFVGGARVRRIKNYNYDNTFINGKGYRYELENYTNTYLSSSGKLIIIPQYIKESEFQHFPTSGVLGSGCNANSSSHICNFLTIYASDISTLGNAPSYHLYYSRVIEEDINNVNTILNGKTIYHFTENAYRIDNICSAGAGLITKIEVRNQSNLTLKETINNYNTIAVSGLIGTPIEAEMSQNNKSRLRESNNPSANCPLYVWVTQPCPIAGAGFNPHCACAASRQETFYSKFKLNRYHITEYNVRLHSTIENDYFYNANSTIPYIVSKNTSYVYGNGNILEPTEIKMTNSNSDLYTTKIKYAHDLGIQSLIDRNMKAIPIEKERYLNNSLVASNKLQWSEFNPANGNVTTSSSLNNWVLPDKFFTKISATASFEEREVIEKYDISGNIIKASKTNDVPSAYLWDKDVIIAKAKNANPEQIAYWGMEYPNAKGGNFTFTGIPNNHFVKNKNEAKVGEGYFNGTALTASFFVPSSGNYLLSYYCKNANGVDNIVNYVTKKNSTADNKGWIYIEKKLNLTTAQTLNIVFSGAIDELRICPVGALMNTYSYNYPNKMLNAIADENSLATNFEYDGLLRLDGIRNMNKEYLKSIEYYYRNGNQNYNQVRDKEVWTPATYTKTAVNALTGTNVKTANAFVDGLGRSLQENIVANSPSGNDIINFHLYDAIGRENEIYLPFTKASNNGAYNSSALTDQDAFYDLNFNNDGVNAKVKVQYEASPLNRVLKKYPESAGFKDHPIEIIYATNAANEVRRVDLVNTFYPANTLYKVIQKDENTNPTVTFKDKLGRLILMEKGAGASKSQTYYLYDAIGNLTQVLQPAASASLGTTFKASDDNIKRLSFLYNYDTRNRLIKKHIPGTTKTNSSTNITIGFHEYVYDRLDRPVLMIDPNGTKIFTKYDGLSRVVATGKYTATDIPNGTEPLFVTKDATQPHFYNLNLTFPTANTIIYSINYYDSYNFNNDGLDVDDVSYASPSLNQALYPSSLNYLFNKGKMTASKVAVLNETGGVVKYLQSVPFYDIYGRVIHATSENNFGGSDFTWTKYDFVGKVLNTRRQSTNTVRSASATTTIINERFVYNGQWLVSHFHNINDAATETQLSALEYTERGEIKTKSLHKKTNPASFVQDVDYTYNMRGYLTQINNIDNCLSSDFFHLSLYYGDEGKNLELITNHAPQYNGNIGHIKWRTGVNSCSTAGTFVADSLENSFASNPLPDLHAYAFSYDDQNRLTDAIYGFYQFGAFVASTKNRYNEENINYDFNGNITALKRNGKRKVGTSVTFPTIDNLTYTYDINQRLIRVSDAGEATIGYKKNLAIGNTNNFAYDDNGNLTFDGDKAISNITYNHLNLPTKFTSSQGTIEITYDASGRKWEKKVTVGTNISYKSYNAGIEFNTTSAGTTTIEGIYHAEGRVIPQTSGLPFQYQYVIKDHLGNTRVMFRVSDNQSAAIIQENNYYAFGMEMDLRTHNQVGVENPYQYNGKELNEDLGLNLSDYGARWYDAAIARFTTIDPLAEAQHSSAIYHYAANNPMRFIDYMGLAASDPEGVRKERAAKREQRQENTNTEALAHNIAQQIAGGLLGGSQTVSGSILELPSGEKITAIEETITSQSSNSLKNGDTEKVKSTTSTFDIVDKNGNIAKSPVAKVDTNKDTYSNEKLISSEKYSKEISREEYDKSFQSVLSIYSNSLAEYSKQNSKNYLEGHFESVSFFSMMSKVNFSLQTPVLSAFTESKIIIGVLGTLGLSPDFGATSGLVDMITASSTTKVLMHIKAWNSNSEVHYNKNILTLPK